MSELLYSTANIAKSIAPAFGIVIILMFVTNLLLSRDKVKKSLSGSEGIISWFTAVASGLLSTGPIYVWYPLLKEAKDAGVSEGLLAVFLYNRAVKLPLIPLLVSYMGLKYTVSLTLLMIIFSLLQGLIFKILYP